MSKGSMFQLYFVVYWIGGVRLSPTETDRGAICGETVTIPESTALGLNVYHIEIENHQHLYLNDGNVNERFGYNPESGNVNLTGLLDYQIKSLYELQFKVRPEYSSREKISCQVFSLQVFVQDDEYWPPYFASVCLAPYRVMFLPEYPFPYALSISGRDSRQFYSYGYQGETQIWFDGSHIKDSTCTIRCFVAPSKEILSKLDITSSYELRISGTSSRPDVFTIVDIVVHKEINESLCGKRNCTSMFDMERVLLEIHLGYDVYEVCKEGCTVNLIDTSTDSITLSQNLDNMAILGCPSGKYGGQCDHNCYCRNGATCHTLNGACKCSPGWRGVACDIPDPGIFLNPSGIQLAKVNEYKYFFCMAYHIKVRNIIWYFNDKRFEETNDLEHVHLTYEGNDNPGRSELEFSMLSDRNTGNYTCSAVDYSGKVYSDSAYINVTGCQVDEWGKSCNNTCNCKNGATCDRYVGCLCTPGWIGYFCDQKCATGKYGINCKEDCRCENEAVCDSVNGHCQCSNRTCGVYCEHRCHCTRYQRSVCTLDNLCTCETDRKINLSKDKLHLAVVSTVAAVLFAGIILIVLIIRYYKKRMPAYQRLKTEPEGLKRFIREAKTRVGENWLLESRHLEIDEIIGQGDFGQVNNATLMSAKGERKKVAVKSIKPARSEVTLGQRDFVNEIEILIHLKGQENVVEFIGVLVNVENVYIVMELASKGDMLTHLENLSSRNDLSDEEEMTLLKNARDVAKGLHYLQQKRVVHRDIAARNILLMENKTAKICDFGLSRLLLPDRDCYEKAQWSPNPGPLPLKWMPTEFLRNGIFKFQSDIWSFGVFLWEIASLGKTPFAEICCVNELIGRLASGKRLQKPDRCANSLYSLMKKCWQSSLKDRPSTNNIIDTLTEMLDNNKSPFIRLVENEP
ncbi:uncharacterized protein [Ptychodera flava]|uniref:uncharacterized protein n=1 Tax=Ptychodera flava TaxID=63121 RepID=UPI00396A4770